MKEIRLGAVNYLNSIPLLDGLSQVEGMSILRLPPSDLGQCLGDGLVDIALCSIVDYPKLWPKVKVLPVGAIGCAGPTMTVRLFSQVAIKKIQTVAVDCDTHTSIKLLKLWLKCCHHIEPRFITLNISELKNTKIDADAILMIGDKVVVSPPDLSYCQEQVDLGEAWFDWQARPFVFATWMARVDMDPIMCDRAIMLLDRQRRKNQKRLEFLAFKEAGKHGWAGELAKEYFIRCLSFEFNRPEKDAVAHFFRLLHAQGFEPDFREEMIDDW